MTTIAFDTTVILLRDSEVLEHITIPESAGELCTYCRKPIVNARFHWLDENGEARRSTYTREVESFPAWRHADGTEGHGPHRYGPNDHGVILPLDRCPKCRAHDTLVRRDTGYGDDVACTVCHYAAYFDRGD